MPNGGAVQSAALQAAIPWDTSKENLSENREKPTSVDDKTHEGGENMPHTTAATSIYECIAAHEYRYALEPKANGLSILEARTGEGKTHAAANLALAVALQDPDVLADDIPRELFDRGDEKLPAKLIYVTPNRPNRGQFCDDILKLAKKRASEHRDPPLVETVKSKVFEAKSVNDSLTDKLIDSQGQVNGRAWNKIPERIRSSTQGCVFVAMLMKYQRIMADFNSMDAVKRKLYGDDARCTAEKQLRDTEKELRKYVGAEFRKEVSRLVKSDFARATDDEPKRCRMQRIDEVSVALLRSERWSWLADVWPAAELPDKRVLVMTPEKFMLPQDTVIHGIIHYDLPKFLDGAMVIIDESDLAAARIRDRIIEENAKNPVDMVRFIHDVYRALRGRASDSFVSVISKNLHGQNDFDPQACLANIKLEAERMVREFHIDDLLKLSDSLKGPADMLDRIFGDGTRLYSSGMGSSKYYCRHDKREHAVYIDKMVEMSDKEREVFFNEDTDVRTRNRAKNSPGDWETRFPNDRYPLTTLQLEAAGAGSYIMRGLYDLTVNYEQNKAVMEGDAKRLGYERSEWFLQNVSTVLDALGIIKGGSSAPEVVMISQLEHGAYFQPARKSSSPLGDDRDVSALSRGIRYNVFSILPDRAERTTATQIGLAATPESYMRDLCRDAKVLLISATAGIESLDNITLSYVRDSLAGDVVEYPDLKNDMLDLIERDKAEQGGKFSIVAEEYDGMGTHSPKAWAGLLGDTPKVNDAIVAHDSHYRDIIRKYGGGMYQVSREAKLATFIKDATLNEEIGSAICFLSALPSDDPGADLSIKRLQDIATAIYRDHRSEITWGEPYLIRVKAESLKQRTMDELIGEKVAEGRKVFVLTTYQSAGAGMNLQHRRVPRDVARLVRIGRKPRIEEEKDFDAAYFGPVTNVFSTDFTGKQGVDRDIAVLTALWQQAELFERGEITYATRAAYADSIISAASSASRGGIVKAGEVYSSPSLRKSVARAVYQATGRITRTDFRPRVRLLGYDADLSKTIDANAFAASPTSLEYDRLLQSLVRSGAKETMVDILDNKAANSNYRFVDIAANDLRRIREADDPERARALIDRHTSERHAVLMNPTLGSMEEAPNSLGLLLHQGYCELPAPGDHYSYSVSANSSKDLNLVETYLGRTPACNTGIRSVCEKESGLTDLMAVPKIRRFFEDRGYATEWREGRYMMTPALANNAYRGALGEAALECFMDFYLAKPSANGLKLMDMPARCYELFDYRLEGLNTPVYIDAKYWRPEFMERKGYVEKVRGKLAESGGGIVVFTNVFRRNELERPGSVDGSGELYSIPALFDADSHDITPDAIRAMDEIIEKAGSQL